MLQQINQDRKIKSVFQFDPVHTVIQAQREKKYQYQNIFQAIKNTQDYDLGIDGAIIQSLQLKSKLTTLDKQIIEGLFPVKQIMTNSLITQDMITLKTLQQLSAYEMFSKIFVSLMKAMIEVQTQVDPKTFTLISAPNGKTYLQTVNDILTRQVSFFQQVVQELISIFSSRKASIQYIRQQINIPFLDHLTKVMIFFNYNIDDPSFQRVIFNRKSSKVIEPSQIIGIQSQILNKKIDFVYLQNTVPQGASHLIKYLKSVTQRKRIQFRRQHQQRFNGNFAIVTHIPNISGAILNAIDESQYVFDEKGRQKQQYLQYMQKKMGQTAQQIAEAAQQGAKQQGLFAKAKGFIASGLSYWGKRWRRDKSNEKVSQS